MSSANRSQLLTGGRAGTADPILGSEGHLGGPWNGAGAGRRAPRGFGTRPRVTAAAGAITSTGV